MKEKEKSLAQLLNEYSSRGRYPMHMPGHKRNTSLLGEAFPFTDYAFDITEIEGFDDLHDACGILRDISEKIARTYSAREAYMLVNGSTAGILSCIRSATKPGDKIILGRNCHKSVYHALELCELTPCYIYPELDCVTNIACSMSPEAVERELEANPEATLVVLTSPTYEGVVSNIKEIADRAHSHGAKVMLDYAHGAHLGLGGDIFRDDKLCEYRYADFAVMSLHKTLPSMTQTAVVLSNADEGQNEKLRRQLGIFQTSSPSYILLASIDSCMRFICENKTRLFEDWERRIKNFSRYVRELKNLKVICYGGDNVENHTGFYGFDMSKIVISTTGTDMNGAELAKILRERGIEPEMCSLDYVLCMTSVCDIDEGYELLLDALIYADGMAKPVITTPQTDFTVAEILMDPGEAVHLDGEMHELPDAVGKISLTYVWAYPPGVPLLVPGERVDKATVNYIIKQKENGVKINTVRIKAL